MVQAAGVGGVGRAVGYQFALCLEAQQMHRRDAAAIQPVAVEGQWRAVADRQTDDVGVEIFGRLQVARLDGVVVQRHGGHGDYFLSEHVFGGQP